jgi:hypothetical protein
MSANRRQFLNQVGGGMLMAGLGTSLAADLGIGVAIADDTPDALHFGGLEPLVGLMQETPPAELTSALVQRLQTGDDLRTLVAAGALSNARTFGGQDYIGFHTFMALVPAYRMSKELPTKLQALPVLKVLHRNATRIQEFGGRKSEVLHKVAPESIPSSEIPGEYLRSIARSGDIERSDRVFASLEHMPVGEAFNHLQFEIDDEVDVHRVVLAWRAMDTLELTGNEWANCLLRQSIRYCANSEKHIQANKGQASPIRQVLPALLDQYKLLGRELGNRTGDDQWISELADAIFRGTREQSANAVAQSLVEGFSPEAVGEAISIAANRLVLHDPGRPQKWANAEKPEGSCHGDSVGVHASDAANAWRNIVRVSSPRNVVASLLVGAFHTGGQSERSTSAPYPFDEHLAGVREERAEALISQADEAIRNKEQFRAAAIVKRYGQLGYSERPMFNLMLRFATSEDGALHAEKYYHTARVEFLSTRKAFRWNQLVALARVTASEYGRTSQGYIDAKDLLGVSV